MIQITVQRIDRKLHRVTVEGHAGYAEHGEDIVCAAVSAVSIGLINASYELTGIELIIDAADEDGGYLSIELPDIQDSVVSGNIQLLLEAMVSSLRQIAEAYSDFVQITDETHENQS